MLKIPSSHTHAAGVKCQYAASKLFTNKLAKRLLCYFIMLLSKLGHPDSLACFLFVCVFIIFIRKNNV